jgi:hypothetical protein
MCRIRMAWRISRSTRFFYEIIKYIYLAAFQPGGNFAIFTHTGKMTADDEYICMKGGRHLNTFATLINIGIINLGLIFLFIGNDLTCFRTEIIFFKVSLLKHVFVIFSRVPPVVHNGPNGYFFLAAVMYHRWSLKNIV